jgi:hypothetical protein
MSSSWSVDWSGGSARVLLEVAMIDVMQIMWTPAGAGTLTLGGADR